MIRIHSFALVLMILSGMTLPNVDTFGADVSGKAPAGLHSEILYSILDPRVRLQDQGS